MTAKIIFLLLLSAVLAGTVPAQTKAQEPFISEDAPQWVKDLRRWEIVAFGSIPFTMFTATFGMDMYLWNKANGLDFTEEGRRYAPWPMKSAGAVIMDSKDQELVFIMAASLSVAVAFTDLIIVQVKRSKARKRAEAIPAGSAIITRTPLPGENDAVEEAEEP